MTLTERIKLDAAEKVAELSKALIAHAIANPNSQSMAMVLDRSEGRVANEIRVEDARNPFEMTQSQLERWLAETPADED